MTIIHTKYKTARGGAIEGEREVYEDGNHEGRKEGRDHPPPPDQIPVTAIVRIMANPGVEIVVQTKGSLYLGGVF